MSAKACPKCGSSFPRSLDVKSSKTIYYVCWACRHVWTIRDEAPETLPKDLANPKKE